MDAKLVMAVPKISRYSCASGAKDAAPTTAGNFIHLFLPAAYFTFSASEVLAGALFKDWPLR